MCTWVAFGLCVSDMGATLMQVGLGTDVAGGYSPSMLSAMRSAVVAAKATGMLRTDRARLAVRRRPSPSSDQPLASRHLPEPAGASAAAAASATDRGAASGAAGATGRGRTAQGERECRSELPLQLKARWCRQQQRQQGVSAWMGMALGKSWTTWEPSGWPPWAVHKLLGWR